MPLSTVFLIPYQECLEYLHRTKTNFGTNFVTLLVGVYFFVKGMAYTFITAWQLPFYEEYDISSITYQAYILVGATPWTMKGIIGLVSDSWPIFGYHKRSWMLVSSLIGVISCAFLTFFPLSDDTLMWAPILILCINLQMATMDLLCEGKYTELMAKMPETKGDVVTLVWSLIQSGGLIGVVLAGTLSDAVNTVRWTLAVSLIPLVIAVIPVWQKKMPEDFIPRGKRGILWGKLRMQWRIFLLAFLMALGAFGLTILIMVANVYSSTSNDLSVDIWDVYQLLYIVIVSVALCALGFWALPRTLAKSNLFMFMNEVLYVNINGALDYWYTADDSCVPGGPDFSYSYYITWTGVVGYAAAFVGVVLFQRICSDWTFRKCFLIVTVIEVIASIFDIIIVKRWNVDLGISDSVIYLFGDAIINNMVLMFALMPQVILTSKVCPRKIEATVFALLAGFQNFGDVVASSIGIFLQAGMGIALSTDDDFDCQYSNLASCIFIAHFLLPLLALPLIWILIPEGKFDTDLVEIVEEENNPMIGFASKGSYETNSVVPERTLGPTI